MHPPGIDLSSYPLPDRINPYFTVLVGLLPVSDEVLSLTAVQEQC